MKNTYVKPEMEIMHLDVEDVILSSTGGGVNVGGWGDGGNLGDFEVE